MPNRGRAPGSVLGAIGSVERVRAGGCEMRGVEQLDRMSHLLPAGEEAGGDRWTRRRVEEDQRDHSLEVGLPGLMNPGPLSRQPLADRERGAGGAFAQRSAAMERD